MALKPDTPLATQYTNVIFSIAALPRPIYHILNTWFYRFFKGVLHLLLLLILVLIVQFASRPPRYEVTEKLFQGVTYTRLVRSSPRQLVIHVVEIDLTTPGVRVLVTPGDPGCGMDTCAMTTAEFLEKYDVQLAINGSFFSPFSVGNNFWDFYPHTGDPTDILGLAISNEQQYSDEMENYATICFMKTSATITEKNCPKGTLQAMAGQAVLVRNRAAVHFDFADHIHPRTAVAVGDGGRRLWLVVVDGRQSSYSEGVDLNELADLIVQLGASEALNLDGGGSTTLVVSKYGAQTLNAPIHTRLPMRQRPVANHLGIYALPLP